MSPSSILQDFFMRCNMHLGCVPKEMVVPEAFFIAIERELEQSRRYPPDTKGLPRDPMIQYYFGNDVVLIRKEKK